MKHLPTAKFKVHLSNMNQSPEVFNTFLQRRFTLIESRRSACCAGHERASGSSVSGIVGALCSAVYCWLWRIVGPVGVNRTGAAGRPIGRTRWEHLKSIGIWSFYFIFILSMYTFQKKVVFELVSWSVLQSFHFNAHKKNECAYAGKTRVMWWAWVVIVQEGWFRSILKINVINSFSSSHLIITIFFSLVRH